MVAGNIRSLELHGVGAALPQPAAASVDGAHTSVGPVSVAGERQRAKWLQNIRLWPNAK
jgi:hypothetical protein